MLQVLIGSMHGEWRGSEVSIPMQTLPLPLPMSVPFMAWMAFIDGDLPWEGGFILCLTRVYACKFKTSSPYFRF